MNLMKKIKKSLLTKNIYRDMLGTSNKSNRGRRAMQQRVQTKNAPEAIGPYSQAVICEGMVYTSGQIPLSPVTGAVIDGDISVQATQTLENLKAVLEAAGSSPEHVVKTTCFLADMADFTVFNSIYATFFPNKPARSCVAVKQLPKGVLVEVEAVAEVSEKG